MIKIQSYENYLNSEIEELLSDEKIAQLSEYKKRDSYGPFACAELMLPTLVTVYILQPFFKSIISEFGKDTYSEIKNRLASFSRDAKKKSRIEPSFGRFQVDRKFSHELSFSAQIGERKTLKLMFPVDFSDIEYLKATSCFLDFLKNHELGLANLESIGVDINNRFVRNSIGIIYEPELKALRWYNPMPEHVIEEIRREIEQKNT